jgi:hypothetical protein
MLQMKIQYKPQDVLGATNKHASENEIHIYNKCKSPYQQLADATDVIAFVISGTANKRKLTVIKAKLRLIESAFQNKLRAT